MLTMICTDVAGRPDQENMSMVASIWPSLYCHSDVQAEGEISAHVHIPIRQLTRD